MKSLIQTLIEKGYAKTEKEAMQIICEIRNAINQGSTLKDVLEDLKNELVNLIGYKFE